MKKYRIGFVGLDHTHANILYQYFNREMAERVEWVGYAHVVNPDSVIEEFNNTYFPELLKNVKKYDDYKNLLDQNLDIAIVCCGIEKHAEICVETLKRNIHTIVEKPMAMNLKDAIKMYKAAKKSKGELVINWPVAWFPTYNKAKELADAGKAGKILRVIYRTPATWGPFAPGTYTKEEMKHHWWYSAKRCGGSIFDYAGYSCVLSTYFINEYLPKKVSGFKKTFIYKDFDIEDYSVFTAEYENAIGQIEGSWSTVSSGEIPTGPVIYGTEGTIVCDRYSNIVKVFRKENNVALEPEVYTLNEIEKDIPLSFIEHLETGAPLHEMVTLDFNMRAMALLDGCIRAANKGTTVKIKKTW